MKIVLIDNYDSFSYILVDLFRSFELEVVVLRNTINVKRVSQELDNQSILVLSPGPGTPSEAGNLGQFINYFIGNTPILGICLGHQAIVENLGGVISRAPEVVHGKSSILETSQHPLFDGLGQEESIARYHSLIAKEVPSHLEILGEVDGIPMIVYSRYLKVLGLQFHPESILTINGAKFLNNALKLLGAFNESAS